MNAGILKIASDPNPFAIEAPSIMAQRLNRLLIEGYEVIPYIDCALIVLKYPYRIRHIHSPIMILGNGDLATFEGWPYELDRIFIAAGDGTKFERFMAGIPACSLSWRGRLSKATSIFGEYLLIATLGLGVFIICDSLITGLFK